MHEIHSQQTTLIKLIEHYDAYLIDLWGVVYDGLQVYPKVTQCLHYLTSQNKTVIFLSNAPRPGNLLANKLQSFGIQVTADRILTSGDLIRNQLVNFNDTIFSKLGRRFYHLGTERNTEILAGIPVDLTLKLETANFILLTAYLEEDENTSEYDILLDKALTLGIPILCANPDKIAMHGDKIRYCAGFLAERYQKMGGIVHYYGKPYLNIYEAAFKKLQGCGIQDKNRILMIGDTLETDIKGALHANIPSALVLTGNTQRLLSQANIEDKPEDIETFLLKYFDKQNIKPNWVLPSLSL